MVDTEAPILTLAIGERERAVPRRDARAQLPPRLLPVLYVGAAHVALLLAWLAIAIDPRGVAGFFYHSRMLAVVHLVTLGWITASILGFLYVVGPVALRVAVPATWFDYGAFAFVLVGTVGMVGHFVIQEYGGMAWSGMTVGTGVLAVGLRMASRLRRAALPAAVKAHVYLAFLNIAGAAVMGVLIGFDKVYHFLPGYVLDNVFAHAHLAAIGWASMMVIGVGYRLLPMVLPAAMPSGPTLWASAVLIECGVAGLFAALVVRSPHLWPFALLVVGGFGAFVAHVVWMLRHRRPRPPLLARRDPAVLHAGASFLWLVVACVLGLWLAVAAPSENALRIAAAYGVFGLVGSLAQMVVGMEGRLLPIFAWYWAHANTDFQGPVLSQHEMAWRDGRDLIFVLWQFGVPFLAVGLAVDAIPLVRSAAWCLLAATILDATNAARILRHAFSPTVPAAPQGEPAAPRRQASR